MSATAKAWSTRINGYIFQLRSLFDWDGCYLGSFSRLRHLVVVVPNQGGDGDDGYDGDINDALFVQGLWSPLCSDFSLRKINRNFQTKKQWFGFTCWLWLVLKGKRVGGVLFTTCCCWFPNGTEKGETSLGLWGHVISITSPDLTQWNAGRDLFFNGNWLFYTSLEAQKWSSIALLHVLSTSQNGWPFNTSLDTHKCTKDTSPLTNRLTLETTWAIFSKPITKNPLQKKDSKRIDPSTESRFIHASNPVGPKIFRNRGHHKSLMYILAADAATICDRIWIPETEKLLISLVVEM